VESPHPRRHAHGFAVDRYGVAETRFHRQFFDAFGGLLVKQDAEASELFRRDLGCIAVIVGYDAEVVQQVAADSAEAACGFLYQLSPAHPIERAARGRRGR